MMLYVYEVSFLFFKQYNIYKEFLKQFFLKYTFNENVQLKLRAEFSLRALMWTKVVFPISISFKTQC